MVLQKNENIVIVGAGVFGVSAAYHFLERGYQDVTILDRSQILPAPDAASNDINRVVRCSYDDKFYTDFALQAISSWKDQKRWGDTYHETGVIVLGLASSSYADEAYKNDVAAGASVEVLKDSDSIRKMLPSNIPLGPLDGFSGYLNRDGGWANAGQGVSKLIEKVKELNGKFIPGKDVSGLLQVEGKTTGVQCSDGTTIEAALTIIATGSWTPSSFSDLGLGRICLATGQTIAMIQLSESEAERYKDCPVLLDFGSGFYIFPVGTNQ